MKLSRIKRETKYEKRYSVKMGELTTQVTYATEALPSSSDCYASILVKNTDFDEADKYVLGTTVNDAQLVHGRCSPRGRGR